MKGKKLTKTLEDRLKLFSPASLRFSAGIADAIQYADLTTTNRITMFLAQCAHESSGFLRTVENLNYSADGLLATFHNRFTSEEAKQYARKPEQIANHAYSGTLGNGDEASGDGWKFRGRGLIQLTCKGNYAACSLAVYGDDRLLSQPQLLEAPSGAAKSAAYFWRANGLNKYADAGDFEGLTGRINRAKHGLDARKVWLEKAIAAWSA